MNFSDPISRGKQHLAEITGGEWFAEGFTVKTRTGKTVGHMQRSVDAAFVAEAGLIISMLTAKIAELAAETKKARYAVSADQDLVTTLTDQLANSRRRCAELQTQLDDAVAELETFGRRR
jgi:hypothetical protein